MFIVNNKSRESLEPEAVLVLVAIENGRDEKLSGFAFMQCTKNTVNGGTERGRDIPAGHIDAACRRASDQFLRVWDIQFYDLTLELM